MLAAALRSEMLVQDVRQLACVGVVAMLHVVRPEEINDGPVLLAELEVLLEDALELAA